MDIQRTNGYALAPQALPVWLLGAAIISALLLARLVASPLADGDWHQWTNYTARVAFPVFLLAYLASPLYEISQNSVFTWLRKNRRNTGIAFGFLHIVHLAALVLYFVMTPTEVPIPTVIGGGIGYVFLFAMLATSNNAAIRRLGAKKWGRIHKFGIHYIAIIFATTYSLNLVTAPP